MPQWFNLYDNVYGDFGSAAEAAVRQETYGEEIGQSSWMTAAEWRRFAEQLQVQEQSHVLEVGSGSGGPAVYLAAATGCRITGVDINEGGIRNGERLAKRRGVADRVRTHEEIALRSSVGFYLFVPPGENERLIEQAGFRLLGREDVTEGAAVIAERWHAARERHRAALVEREGAANFDGLQRFLACCQRVSAERRLSRYAYLAEKPA